MKMPEIHRYPTEIFGYPFIDASQIAKKAIETQFCRFTNSECTKPRKSEPHIKIGICSVGYKGSFMSEYSPVIVCPMRFKENSVFQKIENENFRNRDINSGIIWTTEVSLGVGGSVDYVASLYNKNNEIDKFICVEFQAAGTTGTPWVAFLEFKETGSFKETKYKYGINWANEFVKTMMQQVYKKGRIIQTWKEKMIFVLQDCGLEYLRQTCDVSGLRPANDSDSIHFYTFSLKWVEDSWKLFFEEKVSTDVDGIIKIIGGAIDVHYLSHDDFVQNIHKRINFVNFKL